MLLVMREQHHRKVTVSSAKLHLYAWLGWYITLLYKCHYNIGEWCSTSCWVKYILMIRRSATHRCVINASNGEYTQRVTLPGNVCAWQPTLRNESRTLTCRTLQINASNTPCHVMLAKFPAVNTVRAMSLMRL